MELKWDVRLQFINLFLLWKMNLIFLESFLQEKYIQFAFEYIAVR